LKLTDDGEIGASVYSSYPYDQQKAYLLYREAGGSFQLDAVGSTITGTLDTGLTPQVDNWYQFKIQVTTHISSANLRAKVWLDGQSEPADWPVIANDTGAGRLTAGTIGVRSTGAGSKYFDDLKVEPLTGPVAAFVADATAGSVPLGITFTNLSINASSYLWDFGDGNSTFGTTSPVHTYTHSGSYIVTLTAGNGTLTDTLTWTSYISLTPPVSLTHAFAFGADTWTRATYNEPGINYTKVEQNGQNFTYSAAQGHGYTVTTDMDGTPNNQGVYTGTDEIYDQYIGAKNSGQIIFRIDLPNGNYRFVAAGGDPNTSSHSDTILIQNGASGPTLTLVSDFDPTGSQQNWTVGFSDKQAPPADGVGTQPTFFPQADSGLLAVTDGYIEVIQQVGSGHSRGGDLNLLEVWEQLEDPGRDWSQVTTTLTPTVIGEHAMTYDPDRERVVLYGGNATGSPYETTTWELSGTTWLTTTTSGPNARYGAQMAYDGTEIILFSGSDENDVALGEDLALYQHDVEPGHKLRSAQPDASQYGLQSLWGKNLYFRWQ